MRRAVITGLGAVSCIGNTSEEILDALKSGRSGIVANETFREMGLRSQVSGSCSIDLREHIDRKVLRFMGCLLYTSPSPRDATLSRMPSSA